ncbi:MAG: ABC-F family ATP-binding cassette domain-containing protein [Candidatus Flexifilum sp.]
MSLLTGRGLGMAYGADTIFSGVTIEIPQRARIALVGPNGAGKTTLLRLLIGQEMPTEGEIARARGLRIGFLPQRPEVLGDHVLYDELLSAFAELRQREAELAALEARIAAASGGEHDDLLARYGELQEAFERAGGYTYDQRIKTVLHGLGFKPEEHHRRLSELSGGQKTRAVLGRLLLEAPDLLLLDEPTNHLDIAAVEWLEGYLREFPGAVLVVSHDRYFIDHVAEGVWELDFGQLEVYRGNYSQYAQQREERHARRLKEYEEQQAFIAREMEYVRRNIAGQNTRQAKGRLTRLQRLLRDDARLRPRTRRTMNLRIDAAGRSGDLVLRTRGVRVGYPDRPLFDAPDLTLRRGEIAALIGPNGVGKSTFVKTIIGQLPPLAGEVVIGASVQIGYFAQGHEQLDPDDTLIDAITAVRPMGLAEARRILGGYLFEGDDVFRTIGTLSGGERGRIALARLALTGANFLILDEPTNHLDIPSQEILQAVLVDFDGTALLVSHDRYLIDALATQIWALSPGRLEIFAGTYTEFLAAREAARLAALEREQAARAAEKAQAKAGAAPSAPRDGLNPYKRKQRIEAIEAHISALEARLADLTAQISAASAAGQAGQVTALGRDYQQAEADLAAAMLEWERLHMDA